MSGSQHVSDAAFQSFEASIEQIGSELATNLKTLANAVATVEAAWKGAGASAFQKAQSDLNLDHEALQKLIKGIHEAVVLTHRSSGANDSEIAGRLQKVDVNGGAAGGQLDPGSSSGVSKIDLYGQ